MSMVARKMQEQEQRQVQTKKRIHRVRMQMTLGEKAIIAMMAVMSFIILSIVVHNYVSIYSTNQEVYQLEAAIGEQVQQNAGLSLQVLELSAPDRILDLATEELGMVLDDNKVKIVQN
ncbi:cell division protein FtsL [Halalkalibacter nanhaiisediminis]|uniref:Cell division protein FtsL n=1 Tax=Halalkalibacter nanhaiisediminis TaxID=688079 RepID=A0A562QGA0_9BACI|nr:cell division protein FtsL [Halalkalibacter nanhaiisediminis]TWI55782.1 cell division protein FtsL [Halalkalibacter nanhaiisediminis]